MDVVRPYSTELLFNEKLSSLQRGPSSALMEGLRERQSGMQDTTSKSLHTLSRIQESIAYQLLLEAHIDNRNLRSME